MKGPDLSLCISLILGNGERLQSLFHGPVKVLAFYIICRLLHKGFGAGRHILTFMMAGAGRYGD